MCLRDIAGPDSGCETVERVICPLDDLAFVLERQNAHHWAEDFVRGDRHVVGDVGEDCRFDEVALVAKAVSARQAGCSRFPAFVDVGQNLVELRLIDLRSLRGRRIERISEFTLGGAGHDAFDEFVADRFLHEDAAAGTAALSLIEKQSDVGSLSGRIHVRIGKDHVGALATEFERQSFQRIG